MIEWLDYCAPDRVRLQSPYGISTYICHDRTGIVIEQDNRVICLPWSSVKFLEVIPS